MSSYMFRLIYRAIYRLVFRVVCMYNSWCFEGSEISYYNYKALTIVHTNHSED